MSEQNKIPTNSELLWKWAKKIGWEEGCDVTCEELWELIKAARAAGREEQRIRDAERVKKRASELKASQEFYFEACELERQAEAIRAQGEGEK